MGLLHYFDTHIASHNGIKRKNTVIDTQSHAESLSWAYKIPWILKKSSSVLVFVHAFGVHQDSSTHALPAS
jgi:hypothetical protein